MTDEIVTIRDLQRHAAEIFERVGEGHSIAVTRYGVTVGRILPPDPAEEAIERAISRGILDPAAMERLPSAAEAANMEREPTSPGEKSASEVLMELRDEDEERL